jgi:hypothetical protein
MFASFDLLTSGDGEPCLLDTSAALAFVQPSHNDHASTSAALVGRPKGLAVTRLSRRSVCSPDCLP